MDNQNVEPATLQIRIPSFPPGTLPLVGCMPLDVCSLYRTYQFLGQPAVTKAPL
jgi:hypothetical protein